MKEAEEVEGGLYNWAEDIAQVTLWTGEGRLETETLECFAGTAEGWWAGADRLAGIVAV